MMLRRVVKMFGALGTGISFTLISQLVLPPLFLYFYGVTRYGEWLVLSGTLTYLYTLNFGITTYASNELTMLRKRGKLEEYAKLQGSALCLLLCLVSIGILFCLSAFVLPLGQLLHLSTTSLSETRLTAFLLGAQALANILGGYYSDLFLVIEEMHRGLGWYNARRFSATLASIPLIMLRVNFAWLAAGQLIAVVIVTALGIYDLKRRMGNLPLGLRGANWDTAKAALAPSGMFGMIFMQQFLIFQAPLIMLQWLTGPAVVVLFSICRMLFSATRQLLQTITSAIAPEITLSFADRDMKKLLSIFHYSEKIVFALTPVANIGTFMFSPILLQIWIRKPLLFDPLVYALMALISSAMSMREHKQFFQFSTNTHKTLSIIVFFGNILMLSVSVPLTQRFGLCGFMSVWLISETVQMGLLYRENRKLFHNDRSISPIPVCKMGMVLLISLPICAGFLQYARQCSLFAVGAVAVLSMTMVMVESYFLFGFKTVLVEFRRTVRESGWLERQLAR